MKKLLLLLLLIPNLVLAEKFYFECYQESHGMHNGKLYIEDPVDDISMVYDNETKTLAYRKYPRPHTCTEKNNELVCTTQDIGDRCYKGICRKELLTINRVTLNYEKFMFNDKNSDTNSATAKCKVLTKRQF
jgi:hypothetical protein